MVNSPFGRVFALEDNTERCRMRSMTLRTYFMGLTVEQRAEFAARCGTTRKHLTNVAYGYKPCSEKLAINIERESGRKVLCESICPDADWAYIRATGCEAAAAGAGITTA